MTLTKEETIVYDLIRNSPKKITQLEIARAAPELGSHKRHEGYMTTESTLREIRQIIRDLRIKHSLFILSDKNGYWIMKEREEAVRYITRIEKTAKAAAKAYYVTYNAMKRNFGINSDYLEKQLTMFE